MSASPRNRRDAVWFIWFILQALVIFCVDGVQFYPAHLYQPPGSPLHFLQRLRDYYITTYRDPLVQEATAPPFMRLLFAVEVAFQLPVTLHALYWSLLARRQGGTTGALELVWLVYAFETAFSTALCMHEVAYFDPASFTWEDKFVFWFQLLGPWFAVPTAMFVDMFCRLYVRVSAADTVKKNQ